MTTRTPPISTPGVMVLPFVFAGATTATAAAKARFTLPLRAKLLGAQASARSSSGTTPTLAVDVQVGGVTALSAPIDVTAAAVAEGTIATAAIADEAEVTIDMTLGGTSPTFNDVNVVLTIVRV